MVEGRSVGPDLHGQLETYQLIRRLQNALFGAVYEARGKSTAKDFAIKVLHKSEMRKVGSAPNFNFCEAPLSEITFAEVMRGHDHVLSVTEAFEDAYCHYVVFDLARGGDLLEALKRKPRGFPEDDARYLIRQAAEGLSFLHQRGIALQDVSLENLLLFVREDGALQLKVCDPGQACTFAREQNDSAAELRSAFRGLVGKSFRPPELYAGAAYHATKVDAWCLGWSCFYLLTAQSLFATADPKEPDADWLTFRRGDVRSLLGAKDVVVSEQALRFVLGLLRVDPSQRMSVDEALQHPWLKEPLPPTYYADPALVAEERKARARTRARARSPAPDPARLPPRGVSPPATPSRAADYRAVQHARPPPVLQPRGRLQPVVAGVGARGYAPVQHPRSPSPVLRVDGAEVQVPAFAAQGMSAGRESPVPSSTPQYGRTVGPYGLQAGGLRWDGSAQQRNGMSWGMARAPSASGASDTKDGQPAGFLNGGSPFATATAATRVRSNERAPGGPLPAAAIRTSSPVLLGGSVQQRVTQLPSGQITRTGSPNLSPQQAPVHPMGTSLDQTRGRTVLRSPSPGVSPRGVSPLAWKDLPMSPPQRTRALSPNGMSRGLSPTAQPMPTMFSMPRRPMAGGIQWSGA